MAGNFQTMLDAESIARSVRRLGHEIVEHNQRDDLALVGIVRRGATLAQRLRAVILELSGRELPVGTLDISLYRDDDKSGGGDPRLLAREIPFALDGKQVVLVDDVLYTGRTVRAALDALADLGRPARVQLAVLVDRGERELPIRADFIGRNIPTPRGRRVFVRLKENDGSDAVLLGGAE